MTNNHGRTGIKERKTVGRYKKKFAWKPVEINGITYWFESFYRRKIIWGGNIIDFYYYDDISKEDYEKL